MSPDRTRKRHKGRTWLAGRGVTAVATIVGASARRSMTQRATIEDPYADEDFNTFDGDRALVVTTPDGCRWRSAKPARPTRR